MKIAHINKYIFYEADGLPIRAVMVVGADGTTDFRQYRDHFPDARIVAWEPDAENRHLAGKYAKVAGVGIFSGAVAVRDGVVPLYRYAKSSAHSTIRHSWCEQIGEVEVQGYAFTTMLGTLGLGGLDFLVLNCEGGELPALRQVLEGGLWKRIRQIWVSFHCRHMNLYPESVMEDLLKELEEHYTILLGTKRLAHYLLVRSAKGAASSAPTE